MNTMHKPTIPVRDRCLGKDGLIGLNLNHPPPVPGTFDRIFADALKDVFQRTSPSSLVTTHRWTGTEDDRSMGAEFTGRRLGAPPNVDRIVLTHSTQSAIHMMLPALVPNGRSLVVEQMTYPPIRTFAQRYGIPTIDVLMDDNGVEPNSFEDVCRRSRPAALYLVTTFQNPTTITMSLNRRIQIAEIAKRYDVQVIEDDVYSLLSSTPIKPISAIAPENSWYLLGTAKSFAAGLKLAFVVAPSSSDAFRVFWPGVRATYWMAAPTSAALMSNFIRRGGDLDILAAVKKELQSRHQLLNEIAGDRRYVANPGCLHVWFPLPKSHPSQQVADAIKADGVQVAASSAYASASFHPAEAIRVGIGNPEAPELLELAIKIVRKHLPSRMS
ncbi:PLP-dependent aminotransferase family protein [Bradyrhizobium xenonodulans]|uniref:PLP-dependent aminotransferase family protein n=1 Tax=Bradyrhizobium xenonodulans TaxID=2736875 RepID=A0ABY7MJS5_9BRAD|nr:PLP-dependent aminotransferase family protein [Bradyrhizobium xenonodulans]WBL77829.1 PLP-dependent aminotransferase family protein [Bradyrhizobium xenonodulans]